MKPLRALQSLILAFVATGAFAGEAALTPVTPLIDFGVVSPDSVSHALTTASISVQSTDSWSLSATLDDTRDGVVPMSASSHSDGTEIVLHAEGGSTSKMLSGVSMPVASGSGSSAPRIVTFVLEAHAGWSAKPGHYTRNLRFSVDGTATSLTIPVKLDVPQITLLTPDVRPFTIEVADPSKPAELSSDPHLYQILSNTPWMLTASLTGDPKMNGTDRVLQKASMFVVAGSGKQNPIAPASGPIVVATGGETGDQPQMVEVRIALTLASGDIAGTYSAPLVIEARPAAAVPQP